MKKILFAIVFMFASLMATAQVKPIMGEHGYPVSYELTIGKYEFTGDCLDGCYTLSWISRDEDEVEMLYYFLHQNLEEIKAKFGVDIKKIEIRNAVEFVRFYPFKVSAGQAVCILIETEAHNINKEKERKEREDRINSLQNIF